MTALSPTPPGEGKTTTTVGLTDALHGLGQRAMACLREPSMGPVFGMKGGAAGGGYSQVVPMTDINLHFTGDFAAIAAANNLLAALIDNHVHHGNELDIDVRSITWKRVVDMNDRALREVTVALGGHANGFPREDGFDIVVASELMAIFCLTESWADLKKRIGDIVIGYTRGDGAGHGPRARRRRRDGRAAARRARPEPGADHRGRAGLRARRPVRQHRPRVQLGDGDPGRPAAGRHRGHRGRLRRRPGRGEVRRHQVPQVRPASRRRGGGGDRARAEVPRRRRARRPRHRGPRRRRGRHGQPAPAPAQHPRGVRHPVRRRRQPVPDRHRGRDRARSSSWSRPRACGPTRRPTSPTVASARRTSPRVCCRRSTSRRRTSSRSPTTTT